LLVRPATRKVFVVIGLNEQPEVDRRASAGGDMSK